MRLFVKLLAVILIVALAGPFFIKGPDGRPLMTLADTRASIARAGDGFKRTWQRFTTRVARTAGDENAGKVPVHRWRDADGQWHYSDEAPPGGVSEVIYVDPDASRMDPIVPRAAPPATQPSNVSSPSTPSTPSTPTILSPSSLVDAVDDAKAARDRLEQRNEDLVREIDEQ